MEWPDRNGREVFEISGFIEAYARLPGSPKLSIVSKGDKPDFVVREATTGQEFGVELTAVYINDRSVPDVHMVDNEPDEFNKEQFEKYQLRLISAIRDKVGKARRGYVVSRPLILSIYVNEYIGIHLGQPELDALVSCYEPLFDDMAPFSEVVFWALANDEVFRVRPSSHDAQPVVAGGAARRSRAAP